MPPISNAEKQARYRMKEELKKFATQAYHDAQMNSFRHPTEGPALLVQIQDLANLPSGWTKEDFESAVERIEQLRMDLISPNNELENDVYDARGTFEEFGKTSSPSKLRKDAHKAVEDTRKLAAHLISALEISALGSGEKAAAVTEALRHISRSLALETPVRRSAANAICLSTLPPHYQRPDWFQDAFVEWLAYRTGSEEALQDIGNRALNFKFGI